MNNSATTARSIGHVPHALTGSLLLGLAITTLCFVTPSLTSLGHQAARLITASAVLLTYGIFFVWIRERHGRAHQRTHQRTNVAVQDDSAASILIVFASQTGYAEELAMQTQDSLQTGGMQVHVCDMAEIALAHLQQAQRILFIVSTTGEGDAPDSAARFTSTLMNHTGTLSHLRFAILALGDRNYKAFCAFGHQLNHWLHQQQAQALFDLVEVDNADDGALRHWQHHLGKLSGHTELPDWHPADYQAWTLTSRTLLNPNSLGKPAFLIRLQAPSEQTWQAGDIAEILPRSPSPDDQRTLPHREYSIASIPKDGSLDLIVRQMQQADGSLGLGSGWLTQHAKIGDTIHLRIRSNRSFHAPSTPRPMILIGNGTGIAGLRAHLKQRKETYKPNWLIFGERKRAHDYFCQNEIETWQTDGTLSRLNLAFSRDQDQRNYVQDQLHIQADTVREWIAKGAAIYVCGSLEGMASGVDAALREIVGDVRLEQLREQGFYRRDVY